MAPGAARSWVRAVPALGRRGGGKLRSEAGPGRRLGSAQAPAEREPRRRAARVRAPRGLSAPRSLQSPWIQGGTNRPETTVGNEAESKRSFPAQEEVLARTPGVSEANPPPGSQGRPRPRLPAAPAPGGAAGPRCARRACAPSGGGAPRCLVFMPLVSIRDKAGAGGCKSPAGPGAERAPPRARGQVRAACAR